MTLYSKLQAERSVKGYTARVEERREIVQALLGDGAGNVEVTADPGWVWCRMNGDPDGVIEAKNRSTVPLVEGIVVDLQRVWPGGLGYYEVLGLSATVIYETATVGPGSGADADGHAAVITPHAAQHVIGDRGAGGYDPLTINVRALAPLRARPRTVPNLTVWVDAGYYFINSYKAWVAASSPAFTPPVGGYQRYDLLYLAADDALHILQGTAVLSGTPAYPTVPTGVVPICYIHITGSTTTLIEADIVDARVILTASVPALTPSDAAHTVMDETSFGLLPDVGISLSFARADHTHGSEPHDLHSRLGGLDTDVSTSSLHHTIGAGGTQAAAGNHTHGASNPVREMLFTREGTLTVLAGTLRIYNKLGAAVTISQVFISVNTAPTGANAILVDIHKNGTTIFTNQANRPTITATNYTGFTTTIDVPTLNDGDYLTADVDQIGSTIAGADLTIHVIYS